MSIYHCPCGAAMKVEQIAHGDKHTLCERGHEFVVARVVWPQFLKLSEPRQAEAREAAEAAKDSEIVYYSRRKPGDPPTSFEVATVPRSSFRL